MSAAFYTCAHCTSPIKQGGLLCPSCGRSQKRGGAALPSAMAVALGLTIAGCGDKDDDDTGTPDDTGVTDTDEDTDVDETGGADYGSAESYGVDGDAQEAARKRLKRLEQDYDAPVDASVED